ncbi:methyltransferase domain-containing protein [uncultured Roseibium sp.]|uniref:methyltransferase domain-containing protein n=1 Tax=uncultured Roseibium sp. TaxID=1936171 RepID=UPI00261C8782|nr:methyltransferase domain-containing protein [uncultured Roseibium sp.]
MLQFDERTTRLLEEAYLGADFSRRRRASFDALQPKPGDVVADIGCGNGLLTLELSRSIGADGKVIGIDPSDDMRGAALKRCAHCSNVEILNGTATHLPLDPASADKAVSLQVFEYLDDLPGAVSEVKRILKPGGRFVVGDMHWDTTAWFSDRPQRMKTMLDIWDKHLVERCVPAVLPPILRKAGFRVDSVTAVPFASTHLHPDGLANMMILLMKPFAVRKGEVSEEEANDWAEEQVQLAKSGRFFFSITHFVITATMPD